MVKTEVGQHPENWRRDWYEGQGVVTDIQTGLRERFLFTPQGQTEDYVIVLGKDISRKAIRDYVGAIDLALGIMYKSAQDSDRPIPLINPPILTLEMLSDAKLTHPDFVI